MSEKTVSANATALPQNFSWLLTQDRIDLIAQELYKLQDLLNRAVPGCREGEIAYKLLTDLRAQSVRAGAQDPFPYMPFTPRFTDTLVPMLPTPDGETDEWRCA